MEILITYDFALSRANASSFVLYSDMVLIQDPAFKKVVELYVKDEDVFFKDFASAFAKLLELGVSFPATKAWYQFW